MADITSKISTGQVIESITDKKDIKEEMLDSEKEYRVAIINLLAEIADSNRRIKVAATFFIVFSIIGIATAILFLLEALAH